MLKVVFDVLVVEFAVGVEAPPCLLFCYFSSSEKLKIGKIPKGRPNAILKGKGRRERGKREQSTNFHFTI